MKPIGVLPAALGAAIFIIVILMSEDDVADVEDDADDADEEQIFKGTPVEIAEAMVETASQPEFIEYDIWEDVTDDEQTKKGKKKSKLQVQRILDIKELWRNMKLLHPSCKFRKNQWKEALKVLRTRQEKKVWKVSLTQVEAKEWAEVVQARLIHQSRHIRQAMNINSANPWLRKLWGGGSEVPIKKEDTEPAVASAACASVASAAPEVALAPPAPKKRRVPAKTKGTGVAANDGPGVGWCTDTKQAWKRTTSTKVCEHTTQSFIPLDATDDDNIHAKFRDGSIEILGMSVSALRAIRLAELQKGKALISRFGASSGTRWFATYVKRDDRVTIWTDADTKGKKKQQTMLVTGWFGRDCDKTKELEDQQADNYDRARFVAIDLIDYATGPKIDENTCDFNGARDDLLKKLGYEYAFKNISGGKVPKVQPAVKGKEAVESMKAPKAKQAAGTAAAPKAQAAADSRAAPKAKEAATKKMPQSLAARIALLKQFQVSKHGSLADTLPPICSLENDNMFD